MSTPRAYTAEEVKEILMSHFYTVARYWASRPDVGGDGKPMTHKERCEGVVFSLLVALDGRTDAIPAITLKLDPHPDDREFCKSEGQNWFEPGMEISDTLHEHFGTTPQEPKP